MFLLPIEVETYAGGRSDEAPRVIHGFDGPVEIEELLDRWYEASEDPTRRTFDYFRVRGTDAEEHLLKHDREADRWYLCLSDSTVLGESRQE